MSNRLQVTTRAKVNNGKKNQIEWLIDASCSYNKYHLTYLNTLFTNIRDDLLSESQWELMYNAQKNALNEWLTGNYEQMRP